ncbi:ABC transporter ATP-binding protein [Marinobacter salinisoli]|uniref:ABC transporter ATP-binding protein n=1 Tax=Marinobacter salinisoli TaxID=2769486 RepID=A0ABX7MS00_9GAMM|nr:ABC transporter ATP-binding protein [Marinobacter salinisoli]QSP95151.1 ABC transporter ATP-binding protein [Marinobacter salinisoli]
MNIRTPPDNQPAGGTDAPAIQTRALEFQWRPQQKPLTFPDICLQPGEHMFLHGPSGVGKSTFLSLLSGMLTPRKGTVALLGTELSGLTASRRDRFRADHLGVIFQQFNLVPYLTAMANVTLPCRLSRLRKSATAPNAHHEARRLLSALTIPEDLWNRKVTRLSIGQQQRIAAARALIGAPGVILADEPTSALDTDNRDRFLDLLLNLANERGTSVLFVSHDHRLSSHFHHHMELSGGHA